jgi:hypothetical protein
MKSCRNCDHSRHEGSFRVGLVCSFQPSKVLAPFTKCIAENLKADQQCRSIAARCNAYTPEGEIK